MEEIQEIVNELKNAKIVSIIGKVGTGKTTFATNIIKNMVMNNSKNVAVYSFEETSVSLISLITQMTTHKLNAFINKTDFEKNNEIKEKISNGFFYLYEGVGLVLKKLKSEIDKLSEEIKQYGKKLDLILIDYLQLTYPLNLPTDTNLSEIAEENIKKLKEMAKTYNIPIILVTMLSDNKKQELEQRKIIKENSDIVIELERQEKDSMMKLTLPKKETKNINVQFNKTLCEFIEK